MKNSKTCSDCKETKPLDEFYSYVKYETKTYYLKRCKICHVAYNVARDKRTGYQKKYHNENRVERNKKKREYSKTDRGKEALKRASRNYWNNPKNKIKTQARSAVNHAIRDGKLKKPSECEHCGLSNPIEGHHRDYSKPLEVIWLCKTCHENEHHLNERDIS